MNKPGIFITALLVFATVLVFAQNDNSINQKDEMGRKQGIWRQMDEKGKLRYEGYFRDDIPVGEFKHYYEDGKIKAVSEISGNGSRSYTKTYHPNGKMMSEGLYVDQKKDSLWRFMDEFENLLTTETYSAGFKNGEMKAFDQDGQVVEILNYSNDVKHGEWKQFFRNGKPKMEANYKAGKLTGLTKYYFMNGIVSSEGHYDKDLKEGRWKHYNDEGALMLTEEWEKGTLVSSEKHLEE